MANNIGYLEKAFVKAFAETSSSKLKEIGGVVDFDKIMRFSDYLQSGKLPKDSVVDLRNIDNLYVLCDTVPTAGELKGKAGLNLIINIGNSQQLTGKNGVPYVDIGVEDPENDEFTLDKKIINDMEKALKGAVDSNTEEREFDVKSVKDLAEKLDKGKNLVPKSNKEVVERTEKAEGKVDEQKLEEKTEEEVEDEKRGDKLIPNHQKDVIETILVSQKISKADLKQVTTVTDPKELAQMSDKDNINENGEPVIILTLKNKEANARTDRMIAIQGNRVTDTRDMDSKMKDFIVRHGEDNSVINSVEEQYVTFSDLDGQPQKERLIGVEENEVAIIEEKYKDLVKNKEVAIAKINEQDADSVEKSTRIAEITGEFHANIYRLQMETGIALPEIYDNSLNEANRAASIEQKEKAKDVFGLNSDRDKEDDDKVDFWEVPGKLMH